MGEHARRRALVGLIGMALGGSGARAGESPTPALDAERDALIEKIAAGRDSAASVRRFAALSAQRELVLSTIEAAGRRGRSDEETVDARIDGDACDFLPRESEPRRRQSPEALVATLVRRGEVRLPPRNDLDPGAVLRMVELRSDDALLHLQAVSPGPMDRAAPGDLVFVCKAGTTTRREYGEWGQNFLHRAWAVPIAGPPTALRHAALRPILVPTSRVDSQIHSVRWEQKGENVLVRLHVLEAAGPARWRAIARREELLLEVPARTPGARGIAPGKAAWVIGQGQFDPETRKLLIRALAVEDHLVKER